MKSILPRLFVMKANRPLLIVGIIDAASILTSDIFYLYCLISHIPVILSVIFSFFGVFLICSLVLLWLFIRLQGSLSLTTKIILTLWISVSIWYWGFGALYYFTTVNLNMLQTTWAGFAFIWEVPLVGGMLIASCVILFTRIYKQFGKTISQHQVKQAYLLLLHYPAYVALLIFFFTFGGYLIGAVQLRVLANLPSIEFGKNVFNGIVISIFISLFDYLVIDFLLGDLRQQIKKTHGLTQLYVRKLSQRVLILVCVLAMGIVTLIGVFLFQMAQALLNRAVLVEMQQHMHLIAQATTKEQIVSLLQISSNTRIVGVDSGEEITGTNLSINIGQNTGVVFDTDGIDRLIAYTYSPLLGNEVIAFIPMDDFYMPVYALLIVYIPLALFIILFTLVITVFFTDLLSKKLHMLINAIRTAQHENAVPLFSLNSDDELEEFAYAVTVFVDTIQRVVNENKLEREYVSLEKAKLETLLQNLPIGVEVLTMPDGNVSFINTVGLALLNPSHMPLTPENILRELYQMRREDGSVYPKEDNPIAIALHEDRSITASNLFIRKNSGALLALKLVCTPVKDAEGKTTAFIVLMVDMHKEYELDKAKSRFVYFASHELRAPMTAIKGLASMMLTEDFGKITSEQKDALEDIMKSTASLIQVLSGTLSLSRIEAGTVSLAPTVFSLNELLNLLVHKFTPLTKGKNIRLVLEAEEEISLHTDKGSVEEVVSNLIDNAIKYTPHGTVTIKAIQDGGKICIYVTDTGIGIQEDEKEELFKKFSRLEPDTFMSQPGTGLGLYIAKEFAEMLGGSLSLIASAEGKGSTFLFTLPDSGVTTNHVR